MLLHCFSITATLSQVIHVLQHLYCPIYFSPSCFHLCWVSFVRFEPVFGIGEAIFCDHNIFTNSVFFLNPVLRQLQSLTFSPLPLCNQPHLYGSVPDNLWDKYYSNRPLLFTWTYASLKVSQPSDYCSKWPTTTSFGQKDAGIRWRGPARISLTAKPLQ